MTDPSWFVFSLVITFTFLLFCDCLFLLSRDHVYLPNVVLHVALYLLPLWHAPNKESQVSPLSSPLLPTLYMIADPRTIAIAIACTQRRKGAGRARRLGGSARLGSAKTDRQWVMIGGRGGRAKVQRCKGAWMTQLAGRLFPRGYVSLPAPTCPPYTTLAWAYPTRHSTQCG